MRAQRRGTLNRFHIAAERRVILRIYREHVGLDHFAVKGGPLTGAFTYTGKYRIALVLFIYDYTYAIEALKIGEPVEIAVRRGEETVVLKITPTARE